MSIYTSPFERCSYVTGAFGPLCHSYVVRIGISTCIHQKGKRIKCPKTIRYCLIQYKLHKLKIYFFLCCCWWSSLLDVLLMLLLLFVWIFLFQSVGIFLFVSYIRYSFRSCIPYSAYGSRSLFILTRSRALNLFFLLLSRYRSHSSLFSHRLIFLFFFRLPSQCRLVNAIQR